jgi:hypothetical protein
MLEVSTSKRNKTTKWLEVKKPPSNDKGKKVKALNAKKTLQKDTKWNIIKNQNIKGFWGGENFAKHKTTHQKFR